MKNLLDKVNKKYIITLTVCIVAALLFGALGNARLIGNTIEKAMSLCLLGLATAIGARGGLFNVGGEGQLFFGALVSTMIGLTFSDLPAIIVIPIAFIGAVVVGGFYAWIPAMLKVKLGVSEVITTIMLNTVSIKVCTYLVNGPWVASTMATTKGTDYLPDTLRFADIIKSSNLSTGFFAGAVVVFMVWYVMNMTSQGLQMKVTGENRRFAIFSGLPADKIMVASMVASGAICGFVGMLLVYGYQGHMTDGVSNEFYFDGLLVAMIMNYNPVGIIIMSFFFAILSTGSTMMDMTVGISAQLYDIIFSVIIFLMAAQSGFTHWYTARKTKKLAAKANTGKEA